MRPHPDFSSLDLLTTFLHLAQEQFLQVPVACLPRYISRTCGTVKGQILRPVVCWIAARNCRQGMHGRWSRYNEALCR